MAKQTRKLSVAQLEMLNLLAGRPVKSMANLLNSRCKAGIVNPYLRETRTVGALIARGLVRRVFIGQGIPWSGITLTQQGADALDPPAKVIYPQ
jgi:hypothetical protein